MKRPVRCSHSLTGFLSLLLSYLLTLSLFAPFALKRAAAAPGDKGVDSSKNSAPPTTARANKLKGGRRDNELIIRFREGVFEQDKHALVEATGARQAKRLRGQSRLEKLELPVGKDPDALAEELRQNPIVELVEPNFLISKDEVTPNDPRFAEQWALKNTGVTGGQPGADINAVSAWETTTGALTTVIAVIDSGIDFSHPDLLNNQWKNNGEKDNGRDDDHNGLTDDLHGWDWVSNNGVIRDEQGHGTAMAGIIAAQGNNSVGITGVMWRASLMSLRVLDNAGTGDVADAVEALDYAVEHGAQVINCSWGTDEESLALKDAIARANNSGVVVVSSAGNGGREIESAPYYPASYGLPNQIAVASTDSFDHLASWSNYGNTHVAIAAPGTDILTTRMGGGYTTVTGTSASAPLVAGVAGLIKTQRWWLSAAGTRAAIVDGARHVAELSGKVSSGGVVNASGALNALQGPGGAPPSPPPGGGNGGGHGNGNGHNPPHITPGIGSGGRGKDGGFSVPPPPTTREAPGPNLPNLDELRKLQPTQPKAPAPISSNQLCTDCDPEGGGGGGYTPPNDARYSTARTFPGNETGESGVDLGSRNFNWSLPILGLAGRSGLDLNLTLTYNSLLWTKQDAGIKYNADRGFPGPGFRLGFPNIQQRYYNSQVGVWAYMMVTPSGGRVELRQVNGSNIYEAQDGSYTQMTDYGNGTALVRTSDGTQLSFATYNGEMRCTQIKDRNGNYITINYNGYGHAMNVTDTLGRVVTFNYDGNQNLISITQPWGGATHTWATFYYGQVLIQPNFPGLSVNGPNYASQTVLTRVALADGSYHDFSYTTWGQVHQISRYAADNHLLSYVKYNLPLDANTAQSDCPRFTEQRVWVESWNNNAEAVTAYSVAGDGSWSQVTMPDGTIHKEFFATTGWQSGLTTATEVWSGGVKKKWTTVSYTQDNIYAGYQINPRPTESNIHDADGNRRRMTISYTTFTLPSGTSCSLPADVSEYDSDAATVLRRTHTDYRYDAAYLDRRIIGLVSGVDVYDGANNLASKVRYDYDWPQYPDLLQSTPAAATQHDEVNYSRSFCYGRGNKVWEMRFDVTDPNNTNKGTDQIWSYYTTGAVIYARDASGHAVNISYTDSFSDSVNHNTFAYPTTLTDPDGFASTTQYNYDFGAVTRTQDPKGAVATMQYDAAGRTERVTNQFNGAYTRWVYSTDNNTVLNYATIQAGADPAYSFTITDGAGRLRVSGGSHPGSAGGYKAQYTNYDVMGQPAQQSNPTEINGGLVPAGDDAAAGWVWTSQSYDWKGRPLLTTLPDGNTREMSYGGCGCAGGEVVTSRDERGRRRRMTQDALGRLKKVEELNWNQSIYATTDYTYNARDQITNINQQGQSRSFEYDGHGRLWRRTTPEQGQTTYSYFADDTVQTVQDARGATSTFAYNGRHLVTGISYGVPAGVAATPNVTYGYDAAGNRTSMTDGLGSVSYQYNTLSRLESETRVFTGVAGSYTLSYAYNLAGQLTSVSNQWGAQVGYAYDFVGQMTGVTGAGYGGVSTYASNLQYRAFGGLKQMSYGNGRTLAINYNNRLFASEWNVSGVLGYSYSYGGTYLNDNTGRVTYAHNLYDSTLDRSFDYDHLGRLVESHSGAEARAHIGQGPWGVMDGPYSQVYTYDQWGNLTQRQGWGGENASYTASFTNNRRSGASYDAAGNITNDGGQSFSYDATGQQTYASVTNLQQAYDGDRLRAKKVENGVTTYYLRSSVLGGQVIAEINSSGNWARGYVYAGSQMLAIQDSGVYWTHQDPVTKSQRVTNSAGTVVSWIELDPWGGETNRSSNQAFQPHRFTTYERDGNQSDEAMHRRYNRWWSRFDQPDPYEGSYNLTDPQSFNRYAYVQNDPVNFADPNGLNVAAPGMISMDSGYCWFISSVGEDGGRATLVGVHCMDDPGGGGGGGEGGGGGGVPTHSEPPQKQPCNVQIPTDNQDQLALVYTLAHEVSGERTQDGFEKEARGIASAIWNAAYAQYNRQGTIQYGDIHNMVMVRGYISDPNNHPTWGPQDFYDYGRDLVNDVLAGRDPDPDPTRACERLKGIVSAATTPGAGLPLAYKYWQGVQGDSGYRTPPGRVRIRIGNTVFKIHWKNG